MEKTLSLNEAIKLIPDEEQTAVIQWGEYLSRSQWWLGRLVLNRIEQYADEKIKMRLYQAYGVLSGLSARTIRSYVAVCKRFDEDAVEKYNPLPFSHFQFASQFGENAEAVLQESLDKFTQLGRPPSREWLEERFSGFDFQRMQEFPLSMIENQEYADYADDASCHEDRNQTPEHKFTFDQARQLIASANTTIKTLIRVIEWIPAVHHERLAMAKDYLLKLQEVIAEIENEIG